MQSALSREADPRIAVVRSLAALRRLGMTSYVQFYRFTHSVPFVIFFAVFLPRQIGNVHDTL